MPLKEVKSWDGLDLLPSSLVDNRPALVTAQNVSFDLGGQVGLRPAWTKIKDLNSLSRGLYSRGGRLHAVIPGGNGDYSPDESTVTYDPIGEGSAFADVVSRVVAVDTYGNNSVNGPNGYLCVDIVGKERQHHWVKEPVASSATAVNTRISLPFAPGAGMVKIATKIWASDPLSGNVFFSSSVNGPSDWLATADAGSLPVNTYVAGNRAVTALSHFRNRLAVFFADAVQLWAVDPDPLRHSNEQVLNGPGTEAPGTIANIFGDLIFLSRGGFRMLSTANAVGEADPDNIGDRIRQLTDAIDLSTTYPASLWSETRRQYLCAFGQNVLALTYNRSKVEAWALWTTPVAFEYLAEANGIVYARGGDALYKLDDASSIDSGSSAVMSAVLQTIPWTLGSQNRKSLNTLTVRQSAPAKWQAIVDGVALPTKLIPGGTIPIQVPMSGTGRQVALRCTEPRAGWRLEGVALEYDRMAS